MTSANAEACLQRQRERLDLVGTRTLPPRGGRGPMGASTQVRIRVTVRST